MDRNRLNRLPSTGSLVLVSLIGLTSAPAVAQNQADLASRTVVVLQNLCVAGPTNSTLGNGSCDIGFALGGAEQAQAALQVTPREATAASANATQTTTAQVDSEKDRLDKIRVNTEQEAGEGEERLGTFLTASGGFGTVDARGEADQYDVRGGGLQLGVDYRFTDNIVAGVGFGWNIQESDFDTEPAADNSGSTVGGGNVDTNAFTGSLYGSFYEGPFHADGVFSYTYVDYDFERPVVLVDISTPLFALAKGDTGGSQVGVSVDLGYDIDLAGFSFGPTVGMDYLGTWIDGYKETGVPGFPLKYDDQDITSLLTSVGAEASYAISTGAAVIVPHVRATWEHEFENDARDIDANLFVNDSSASSKVFSRTENPDRDYARIGAGFSAQFPGGISAFFDYEGIVALTDVEYHQFTAGGRIQF